jgi:hypothetical protein
MLAATIVLVHLCVVLFITAGLPLIFVGAALGWQWVRSWRWRALHLLAIVLVAGESLLGIACPLTVWEDMVRGREPGVGFIERWTDRVLFYDFPPRVFELAYAGFAVLVALTWFVIPPGRHAPRRS